MRTRQNTVRVKVEGYFLKTVVCNDVFRNIALTWTKVRLLSCIHIESDDISIQFLGL
jgi:hypothetical protein